MTARQRDSSGPSGGSPVPNGANAVRPLSDGQRPLRQADGLQAIRIGDDQIVLKRGIDELLLSGSGASAVVEAVLRMLDGTRNADEIARGVGGPLASDAASLVEKLRRRRMVVDGKVDEPPKDDVLQARFYANFTARPQQVMEELRTAHVVVYGLNFISRALVRSLLEMQVGHVTVVDDPVLGNALPGDWLDESVRRTSNVERLSVMGSHDAPSASEQTALVCATSDFGLADVLIDLNQTALQAGKPYLPAWLDDMLGYVGPLVYPFETACLRCYQLRVDANDPRYEVSNAVRAQMANSVEARPGTGLLPCMASVLGEVAAIEVVKCLSGFAPADAIGRSIELNLVSFRSSVRRVLKVPRCPACSRVMQRTARVVTVGPQIPHRG